MIPIGIFSFFKRKKKDDLGDIPGFGNDNFSSQNLRPTNDFQKSNFNMGSNESDYSMQLIISKLELINARLQNIEQRIVVIEKIARESQEPEKKWQTKNLY